MSSSVQSGDEKKKKAEAEQKVEKVPFLKLFSFADRWDYVLMAVGSLGACAHGASVPVFFIFFGKLINIIGIAYLFPTEVSGRVAKVRTRLHAYMHGLTGREIDPLSVCYLCAHRRPTW